MAKEADVSRTNPTDQPEDHAGGTGANWSRWWSAVVAFWRRRKRWILAAVALAAIAVVAVPVTRVWIAWSRIDRVDFDPDEARIIIAAQPLAAEVSTTSPETAAGIEPQADPDTPTTVAVEPPAAVPFDGVLQDEDHTAVLIIGSDAGGFRADVIMLVLLPANGSDPALVSLPRDLYLDDPCGGGRARINAALNGCGEVSGPNLLAIAVEDFTGVPVDHFVLFDFDGFARVIDAAGGVEICVDHYTFDTKTDPDLALHPGCTDVAVDKALSWVRSRHTRQIVNGTTQTVPGVNDLRRNTRQREIILQLLGRLSSFPNPAELVGLVEAVPGAFTLSDSLSLSAAISLAWDIRGTPIDAVDTPEIPVSFYATSTGAQVLLPTESFAETMGWPTG